jgi:hypothetical protein
MNQSLPRLYSKAHTRGVFALLCMSLLLTFALVGPLNASQRIVLGEEFTNTF